MTETYEVRKLKKEKIRNRKLSLIPEDIVNNYRLTEVALTSIILERALYRSKVVEIEYLKEKLNIDVTKLYGLRPYPHTLSEADIMLNLLKQELFLYKLKKLRKPKVREKLNE